MLLNVLGCRLTYQGQAETNAEAEAWFNIALCPRKPEGSLGRTAQEGHLDFHLVLKLCKKLCSSFKRLLNVLGCRLTY